MASRLPQREIFINMKHGVEAKNYDDLAKAEKLKPLEIELRRLEDLSESIVTDFKYMREREEEMRTTNGAFLSLTKIHMLMKRFVRLTESTNSRVMWLTVFSLCCLLGLATWQVFYLRRYFKSKKLID